MLLVLLLAAVIAGAQTVDPVLPVPQDNKRILGVIPNYKPRPQLSDPFVPMTAGEKFKYATLDSFDPYWWAWAGVTAGINQLDDEFHEFGQGGKGYVKRYGAAFADQTIRNYLTVGILPAALHEDIRYFRRGSGGTWKRAGYAISRILVTRTDSGNWRFNTSEIVGNGLAASISNAYYPDSERNAGRTFKSIGYSVGIDAGLNVFKEFWPDLRRKFFGK
jgi:hypothetical protein